MTRHRHSVRSGSRHASKGQALVEFALVAPIFFLLLFGIIEGGRFILYYQTLNNATREGSRYSIVHGSNSFCP
ncbi:MAG: pilus assembly protein, partial [Chloroflexota bacterium]|nr:pilus assembly protein [Chloroflexota bacterium]